MPRKAKRSIPLVPNNTTVSQQHYVIGCNQQYLMAVSHLSITADRSTSQTRCPPLPSSVQFDNNSESENLLKPMVSLASCDMTLSVSTKQLKV
jgi:hypothetical protein